MKVRELIELLKAREQDLEVDICDRDGNPAEVTEASVAEACEWNYHQRCWTSGFLSIDGKTEWTPNSGTKIRNRRHVLLLW